MNEIPDGYFECPICHQIIEISEELDRQADADYIREFGLEKFEEDKEQLQRICKPCNKILKSMYN